MESWTAAEVMEFLYSMKIHSDKWISGGCLVRLTQADLQEEFGVVNGSEIWYQKEKYVSLTFTAFEAEQKRKAAAAAAAREAQRRKVEGAKFWQYLNQGQLPRDASAETAPTQTDFSGDNVDRIEAQLAATPECGGYSDACHRLSRRLQGAPESTGFNAYVETLVSQLAQYMADVAAAPAATLPECAEFLPEVFSRCLLVPPTVDVNRVDIVSEDDVIVDLKIGSFFLPQNISQTVLYLARRHRAQKPNSDVAAIFRQNGDAVELVSQGHFQFVVLFLKVVLNEPDLPHVSAYKAPMFILASGGIINKNGVRRMAKCFVNFFGFPPKLDLRLHKDLGDVLVVADEDTDSDSD